MTDDRPSLITQIKEHYSCPDLLHHLGLEPPRRLPGKIHCPAHDDRTPSFHVWEDHWYAFCCGQGGDVIDLYQFLTGVDKTTAVRALHRAVGGTIGDYLYRVPEQPRREVEDMTERFEALATLEGSPSYLMGVKGWDKLFTRHDLHDWGIRWNAWLLLIPHYDWQGRVVGVKTRRLGVEQCGQKRALTGSTFTTRLYEVNNSAIGRYGIICEGESDTWALSKLYECVPDVAVYGLPSGVSTWRDEWALRLTLHRFNFLAIDEDDASRRHEGKLLEAIPNSHRMHLPKADVVESLLAGWAPPLVV